MLKKCQKITCFTDEKHEADDFSSLPSPLPPSPCVHSKRPRVCRHHAHMLKKHVRVKPAYIGVFSVSHTTHHNPPHHTETDKERQRQGEKRRRKRRRQIRQDNSREDREDSFSVWWCKSLFCWCSALNLVKPVNARVLSLLNSVKYDSSLISVPLGRSTVFYYLRINFSMQLQFSFFFEFFFCFCSYSFKFFRIIYLCSYSFFLLELILHKYSVEG